MFDCTLNRLILGCSLAALVACSDKGSADVSPGATGGTTGMSGNAGAGGTGGGAAGSAPVEGSRPPDSSSASMASFLASKRYETAPWVSQTAAPRESGANSGSPHERVRVYYNDVLVESFAAGNGSREPPVPHTTGSMAVKVMYDSSDAQVGVAAMLRLQGAFTEWAYYCEGPAGRCATGKPAASAADPLYGVALAVDCGFCHGGNVFSRPPN